MVSFCQDFAKISARIHHLAYSFKDNAPINVKPEVGGGGAGHRVGILTFSKKNYQNPHPRAKNNCQN